MTALIHLDDRIFVAGQRGMAGSAIPWRLQLREESLLTGAPRAAGRWDCSKPDRTPRKRLDVSRLAGLGWRAAIPLEQGPAQTACDYIDRRQSGTEVRQ